MNLARIIYKFWIYRIMTLKFSMECIFDHWKSFNLLVSYTIIQLRPSNIWSIYSIQPISNRSIFISSNFDVTLKSIDHYSINGLIWRNNGRVRDQILSHSNEQHSLSIDHSQSRSIRTYFHTFNEDHIKKIPQFNLYDIHSIHRNASVMS